MKDILLLILLITQFPIWRAKEIKGGKIYEEKGLDDMPLRRVSKKCSRHNESLDFICLNAGCKKRSLCRLCLAEDHKDHQFAFFDVFLDRETKAIRKNLDENRYILNNPILQIVANNISLVNKSHEDGNNFPSDTKIVMDMNQNAQHLNTSCLYHIKNQIQLKESYVQLQTNSIKLQEILNNLIQDDEYIGSVKELALIDALLETIKEERNRINLLNVENNKDFATLIIEVAAYYKKNETEEWKAIYQNITSTNECHLFVTYILSLILRNICNSVRNQIK